MICDSVTSFPADLGPLVHSLDLVNDYMTESGGYSKFAFCSWDCVAPEKARLKVYSSTNDVTFSKVAEVWTLNGRVTDASSMQGLDYLQRLWTLLELREGHYSFTGGV